MRRLMSLAAAGILCSLLMPLAFARSLADIVKDKTSEEGATGECAQYGTRVDFVSTPSEAARLALKQEKLVFVLHVSGNFEDPTFT